MTTHHNMSVIWRRQLGELLDSGSKVLSRAGDTVELIGHQYTLTNPQLCWAGDCRGASLGYAFAEVMWYLSGRDDLDMLGAYAPGYKRFTNKGRAMGAYGYRWRNNPGFLTKDSMNCSQLQAVANLLNQNSQDRRAVITMWDSGDLVEASKGDWNDIPCTLNMQFLARDGELNAITTMRSNDIWLGGIYDPFCFCQVQSLLASMLGLRLGKYVHQAGSFHMYTRNVEDANQALKRSIPDHLSVPLPTKNEAATLITSYEFSPLVAAEALIRAHPDVNLFTALSLIPDDHRWSQMAIRALHDHLMRRVKK